MDTSRQAEICQEARFVLWALRCVVAGAHGDEEAQAELAQGFELADVPETADAFGQLADALCAVQWPLPVWHHPRCSCVSADEMCVLRALAETAERQRHADQRPAQWWLLLLSGEGILAVDAAARSWLAVLERAGVVFPSPELNRPWGTPLPCRDFIDLTFELQLASTAECGGDCRFTASDLCRTLPASNKSSLRGGLGMSQSFGRALVLAALLSGAGLAVPVISHAADSTHSTAWDKLEPVCGHCHNSTDWAGSLAFDTMNMDNIGADAEVWEKAVRKLRGHLMPPPGEEQPPQQTVDAAVTWLETRLDANAAAHPDPGYVGLHRLNRDEYAREMRRILDIPVDAQVLLPKDVASEGFDNQAATLRISPAFLDQYISAARTVARQAIGRVDGKPSSREYRADTSLDQSKHVDGLPLGTRGGFWVDHDFPADGEYVFNIREFFFMGAGYVTKVDAPHTVILTVDGRRVFQQSVGGPEDQKAVDQRQAIAADELQTRFNHITVSVKAGRRRIGVAFIQRSFAESDSPLQPIAMLPEMERAPRIPGFTVSGPFKVTSLGDTPSRQRIFICRPANAGEEMPCARRILRALAAAAFRRPVTEDDLVAPMTFYAKARETQDFEAGIESGLTAILSSTKFLLREVPLVTRAGDTEALGDLELASRLAFFLWSAGPDQRLIELATSKRLHDPAVLDAEMRRMLVDPRASALVDNFALQWLGAGRAQNILPDPALYPDFDRNLRDGLDQELRLFLGSVLVPGHSVLDLLRADTTFLNERLARHYGVPNVLGAQFRPVRLTDPNRFGLLGKGALMLATSYGNRTSPVLRGAWVMEALYGTPPTSPPPGVEQFKESEPGKNLGTVRERLEQHRRQKSCNACHGVMDPLGFALENYDVAGAWRDRDLDAGQDIDAHGKLASGQVVSNPAELSHAILDRPDQFVQAFTEKLMTYALGRQLGYQDMPTVRAIVRQAAAHDYDFGVLVGGIVASDAFRMRRLPDAKPAEPERVAQAGTEK